MMITFLRQAKILAAGALSAAFIFVIGMAFIKHTEPDRQEQPLQIELEPVPDCVEAIRPEPARFRRNTHMPEANEAVVSGPIKDPGFSPGRDLIYIDDNRVRWESDNDKGDTEDDHTIHKSMEIPLRRLINLVCNEGGTLKIQDTYRPSGIHNTRSLHKEGRAIDLTAKNLSLERLAKLAWAAGFDWVYYETRGGHHIHCSVKRQ